MQAYEDTISIGYFESDSKFYLNPSALVAYLQDTAIHHSNSLGDTIDVMAEKRQSWALINWHIEIQRTPKYGETVKIATWCDQCKRILAERSFLIYGEKGEIVIRVASRWVFMDLKHRCLMETSEEMKKKYGNVASPAILGEKYIFPRQKQKECQRRQFIVTRRDTDNNGHTNNVKYIEWAMDDVPDEVYDTMEMVDLKVIYRKECTKGAEVLSRCFVERLENGQSQVISYFVCPNDEKLVYAQVASLWQNYRS